MKVYKNEKLLLSGSCNYKDRLWDIPIKSALQRDNVVYPSLKGNLYSNYTTHFNTIPKFLSNLNPVLDTTLKIQIKTIPLANIVHSIPKFMKALDPMVDQNKFYLTIDKHIKKQHKANVIIRKKQSKVELVRYLHATCLSPTPSTFIRAISNNRFIF